MSETGQEARALRSLSVLRFWFWVLRLQQGASETFGVTDLCRNDKSCVPFYTPNAHTPPPQTALGPAAGPQPRCRTSAGLWGPAPATRAVLPLSIWCGSASGAGGGVPEGVPEGAAKAGAGHAPRSCERPSLLHCSRRGAARLLTPNNGGSEPEQRRRLRGRQRQRHPGPRGVPGARPPGRQQHAG